MKQASNQWNKRCYDNGTQLPPVYTCSVESGKMHDTNFVLQNFYWVLVHLCLTACHMQSTIRKPAKKNMYKGVSGAYGVIIASYWTLAFSGYWAFGSQVQPYILSSLSDPGWTIVMANLFAVIQISGCFQVLSIFMFCFFWFLLQDIWCSITEWYFFYVSRWSIPSTHKILYIR